MKKTLFTIIIALNSFIAFSQCTPNITDSLIAQWNFSGNAIDSSGHTHNGSIVGLLIDTNDRCNTFNSTYTNFWTNNYIDVPDAQELRLNNTDFSISVWIYVIDTLSNQNGTQAVLIKRTTSGPGNHGYAISVSAAEKKLGYIVSGGGGVGFHSKCQIVLNEWQHYVVTYTNFNQETKIYLNGHVTNDTIGIPSPNASANSLLRIGQDAASAAPGNYPFHGRLDDIRMYTRALDSCDVDSLFRLKCTIIPTPSCFSTGMDNIIANNNIKIFPNPTSGELLISFNEGINYEKRKIDIKNLLGQTLRTYYLNEPQNKITLDVTKGIYFLTISNKNENFATKVIMQ